MALAPDDPWASYERTVVQILRPGEGTLIVCSAPGGERGEWPWSSPDPVHILTAWDPGDERPGNEVNRERQATLEAELRPRAAGLWAALGEDPKSGHREEGVAVAGVSEADAVAAAARYGQDAIFCWTPDEWAIVGCTDGRREVGGWSLTRSAPPA
jgi:hypothetical protein